MVNHLKSRMEEAYQNGVEGMFSNDFIEDLQDAIRLSLVRSPIRPDGKSDLGKQLDTEYSCLEINRPTLIMETLKEAESGVGVE